MKPDETPCTHLTAVKRTRGDFKIMDCGACRSWWDIMFPENVKPYPLPAIKRSAPTAQKRAAPKDDVDAVKVVDVVEAYRKLNAQEREIAQRFMLAEDTR